MTPRPIPPPPPCMLEQFPRLGGCCCQCLFRLADHSHPDVDGLSFSNQKGWICIGLIFEGGMAHSGWSEHGLCEMFTPRSQNFLRAVSKTAK